MEYIGQKQCFNNSNKLVFDFQGAIFSCKFLKRFWVIILKSFLKVFQNLLWTLVICSVTFSKVLAPDSFTGMFFVCLLNTYHWSMNHWSLKKHLTQGMNQSYVYMNEKRLLESARTFLNFVTACGKDTTLFTFL